MSLCIYLSKTTFFNCHLTEFDFHTFNIYFYGIANEDIFHIEDDVDGDDNQQKNVYRKHVIIIFCRISLWRIK